MGWGGPIDSAAVERVRVNFAWLLRLRRAGVVGQLATILVVRLWLGVALDLLPLLAIVAAGLLLNVALQLWYLDATVRDEPRHWLRVGTALLGATLVADIVFLSALLFASGGVGNPFWIFYFVNLVLGTVVLGGRWLATVFGVAVVCFAALLFAHVPLRGIGAPVTDLAVPGELPGPRDLTLYAQGLFIAFVTVASFTAYFVRTLNSELARREAQLDAERQRLADAARLEALATLAAGAAHELSSPLSTIAVVARELERTLAQHPDPRLREDAELVRGEVARCRAILDQMSLEAGASAGEQLAEFTVEELIAAAVEKLRDRDRVRVSAAAPAGQSRLRAPRTALTRALRGLVKNALDASPAAQSVAVSAEREGDLVTVVVADAGTGMDPATLARAADPFFTTKEPGQGMGLGLFLTRTLADRLGGGLKLDSEPGRGTVARLTLPAADAQASAGRAPGEPARWLALPWQRGGDRRSVGDRP
jgi:two-component system sensor histidine kinase RegB